jgi:predicted transcriptional regulator of viral defense system
MQSTKQKAIKTLRKFSGPVRTSEMKSAGIHSRTIKTLVESGMLEKLSNGIYRLSESKFSEHFDLAIVASKYPQAIICLASALAYHDITTQIPHEVSVALTKGAKSPKPDFPPIITYRFGKKSLEAGTEEHTIDGVKVKIYSPEKTIADCFKFRNKIGMDIALEALKLYKTRKRFDIQKLIQFGKICRVEKVMLPYLEIMAY